MVILSLVRVLVRLLISLLLLIIRLYTHILLISSFFLLVIGGNLLNILLKPLQSLVYSTK